MSPTDRNTLSWRIRFTKHTWQDNWYFNVSALDWSLVILWPGSDCQRHC